MGHLLFIGPTPSLHPGQIGGTTRSFQLLLDYLTQRRIEHNVIATNRFAHPGATPINAAWVLMLALLLIPMASVVVVNANPRGAVVLAPMLFAYSALWRKPFVFRMFGGDLIEVFEAQAHPVRWLLRHTVFKADLVFLQTRRLVDYFSHICSTVQQLPTARDRHDIRRSHDNYRRRLVFIGQIHRAKGIDHVLRFQQEHAEKYVVHVYGPILDEHCRHVKQHAAYRGVLAPEQVTPTLANYDVLLLPTFHPGEGYPGIVIEANSVGLPAVTTDWLAIPELVRHRQTGLLVSSNVYDEFERVVLSIDNTLFKRMSHAALKWSEQFSTERVCDDMLAAIIRLESAG